MKTKVSKQEIQKSVRVANQKAASNYTDDLTGRVRSKETAYTLEKSVGKSAKAQQAMKDAIHGDEMARQAIKRGAYGTGQKALSRADASARISDRRWGVVEKLAEKAGARMSGSRIDRLMRSSARGLLSPAGLAEEVVGRTMQNVERKKFERAAKAQDKSPVKGTKRRA